VSRYSRGRLKDEGQTLESDGFRGSVQGEGTVYSVEVRQEYHARARCFLWVLQVRSPAPELLPCSPYCCLPDPSCPGPLLFPDSTPRPESACARPVSPS